MTPSASTRCCLSAALLLFVAAGCGHRERVIAWRYVRPGPIPIARAPLPPNPRHGRFCRPPSARLVYAGAQGVNSVETAYYVEIVNRGRASCIVRGAPWLELPAGVPGPVSVGAVRFGPPQGAFGLPPGRRSGATVFVSAVCRTSGIPERTTRIAARLPWSTAAARFAIPFCRRGTSLGVTDFSPPTPPPEQPRRWPFTVALEVPRKARAGTTLRYRVRLTNTSARAFRFPFCPPIDQTITGGAPKGVSTPNCRPAGAIAGGKSLAFAMELRLPPGLAAGPHLLHWRLESVVDGNFAATATVEIER